MPTESIIEPRSNHLDELDYAQQPRPSWRGRMHAITFFLAIPSGVLLILHAHRASARTAAAIYFASVLAVFGTSAAYHRLAHTVQARKIMRRLDHAMIFFLIAGTYTPVCLLAMPTAWGIPVLCAVWVGAVVGFTLKLTAFNKYKWLGFSLYPVLGWIVVITMPVLARHLSTSELVLIIAGGLLYTLGIPVLVKRRPDPWPRTFGYHEVWHTCTVVAGVCHFAMVGLLVGS